MQTSADRASADAVTVSRATAWPHEAGKTVPCVQPNGDLVRYRDLIRNAWSFALDYEAISDGIDWESAGGDSLKIVKFLMHLEQLLGRQIPIELLSMKMTMISLAAGLVHLRANAAVENRGDDQPRVFIAQPISVIEGPSFYTETLLRHVSDYAKTIVLDYASADILQAGTSAFAKIVEAFSDRIAAQSKESGPIVLVGHSYGGCVFFEVARRLEQAGVMIDQLILVDSQTDASHHNFSAAGLLSSIRHIAAANEYRSLPRTIADYTLHWTLQGLVVRRHARAIAALSIVFNKFGAGRWWNRRLMLASMRASRARHDFGRYFGPAVLFCGTHRGVELEDVPKTLGWDRYATNIESILFKSLGHDDSMPSGELKKYLADLVRRDLPARERN